MMVFPFWQPVIALNYVCIICCFTDMANKLSVLFYNRTKHRNDVSVTTKQNSTYE